MKPKRVGRAVGWLLVVTSAGCSGLAEGGRPVLSRFETDPPGASVYIDGGFVGSTPTSLHLPAKPEVSVRIELPGHRPETADLHRAADVPGDAPAGVGWDEVYYWPLEPSE